jgi:hypothetical protein
MGTIAPIWRWIFFVAAVLAALFAIFGLRASTSCSRRRRPSCTC